MSLSFTKMHGVGNDFVLVDGRAVSGVDWSGLAVEMCDRRFGVGADGLLVIDTSTRADIAMRMYNPDGTPDVCGNGLRCVARFAVDRLALGNPGPQHGDTETRRGTERGRAGDWRTGREASGPSPFTLTISTLAGVRQASVTGEGRDVRVTVDMGAPRFAPPEIPMHAPGPTVVDYPLRVADRTLPVTALSTGSTHAVAIVDHLPDDETFQHLSPLVERHPAFPDRTSLMWARVDVPDRIELRIWERGVGETWGCGTGACAAAVAAQMHGLVGERVRVLSRGGEIVVEWREGQTIRQTGPAVYVFEGVYPLSRQA